MKSITLITVLCLLLVNHTFSQDVEYNLLSFESTDGNSNVLEKWGTKYSDAGSTNSGANLPFVKKEKQKVIMGTNVPKTKYDNVQKSFQTEEVFPLIGKYQEGKTHVYLIMEKEQLKEYGFLIRPLDNSDDSYATEIGSVEKRFYILLNASSIEEAKSKKIYETFRNFYNSQLDDVIREACKQ